MNPLRSRLSLLAGIGCTAAFAIAHAERSQPLAVIDVAVTDGRGNVEGLKAGDFEVFVDGRQKPVESFAGPPVPLSVVLLLDVSGSMAVYVDLEDEISRSFAPALQPGDRALVGGIANRVQLAPRFTGIGKELISDGRKAVRFDKDDKFGPSPLWDALDATVTALEREAGRRGIILVTDGRATGNRIGSQAAILRAVQSGIVVHVLAEARALIIRQGQESFARVRPGLALQELAQQTGGSCLPQDAGPSTELPEAGPVIARMVRDLRGMYTLGVSPDGPAGSVHRVEVRVNRSDLSVRARRFFRTR
jgi:VWFA-related protein